MPGDGLGCALRIASEHDDPYPRLLERRDGFRRALLDRVGYGCKPGCFAVHSEKHDGLGLAAPGFRAILPLPCINAVLGEKLAASHQNMLASNLGPHAHPVYRVERAS